MAKNDGDNEDQREDRKKRLQQRLRGISPTPGKLKHLMDDDRESRTSTRRRSRSYDTKPGRRQQSKDVKTRPSSDTENPKRKMAERKTERKHKVKSVGPEPVRSGRARPGAKVDKSSSMDGSLLDYRPRDKGPEVISFEFVLRNHPDCFENLPGLSSLIRDYDIVHAAAAWKLNQNDTGYTRFQNVKTQMTALKEAIRLGTIVHVQDKNQPSRQVEWQESHPQGPWRHVIKLEDNRVMLDKIDETEQLKSSWHDNKGMIRLVLESLQRLFRIPADSRIQEEAFSTHTVAWRLQPDPDMMTAENDRSVPEPVMNGDGDEALFGENPLEYVNFDEEANKPDGLPVKGIVLIKFWSQRSTGEWVKSWGSGWILNRETVVTNGHCVVGRDKRATSAMIYVGYDEGGIGTNGTPKAKETVAGTHVLVQWAYFRRRDRTYDIALIKMATEFKIGRLIEWKPTPRQQEHEIIVAGYPKPDVSEGRRMKKSQGSCTAVESTIEHLFDTLPGSSGSPVLQQGSHIVIGVHRGVIEQEWDEEMQHWTRTNQAVFLNAKGWNNIYWMHPCLHDASEKAKNKDPNAVFILNGANNHHVCELRWS